MPEIIAYTSKDFSSLKAAMLSKVPELAPSWTNLNEGELGVLLVNLVAGVGEMLSFYLDRYAEEQYLVSAHSRDSIKKLARLIDYRLSRPVAARTTLRFSIAAAQTFNITIPVYTVVQTKKGIYFTTQSQAVIYAGNTFVDVDGFQGEYISQSFSATGEDVQSYLLNRPNVAQNCLQVYVGSVLWREDTRDLDYVDSGLFEVDTDANEAATLKFSRYLGSIPSQSATIQAHYLETLGARGNIGSGLATVMVSSFTNSNLVSVTNISSASGGADREGMEEARTNAPRALRAQNRAVTLRDYEDLLTLFPGVVKAKAFNHAGFVELYAAPAAGGALYVEPPVIALSTAANGAATLNGTYQVRVTAVDEHGGETSYFERNKTTGAVVSQQKLQAVTTGNNLVITVTNPAGVKFYNVYVSSDAGVTWKRALANAAAIVGASTILTLSAATGSTVNPPETNTTGVRAVDGSMGLRTALDEYLEVRRSVVAEFGLFNPVYIPINVAATVKVHDNYRQSDVMGQVQTALTTYFQFSNQQFGQEVTVSELYSVIMEVEGVRSVMLSGPSNDVLMGNGEIATKGTVILTMLGGVV